MKDRSHGTDYPLKKPMLNFESINLLSIGLLTLKFGVLVYSQDLKEILCRNLQIPLTFKNSFLKDGDNFDRL